MDEQLAKRIRDLEARYSGCVVMMRAPHPHADRIGRVISLDETAIGPMFLVRFEDSNPIGDEAYFHKPEQVRVLQGGPGWGKFKTRAKIDDDYHLERKARECLSEGFLGTGYKGQLVDSPGNIRALVCALKMGYRMAVKEQEQEEHGDDL